VDPEQLGLLARSRVARARARAQLGEHRHVTLRSYLRLLRIPNVFTAFANVVAGVCLARGGAFQLRDLLVVASSGCLYCAGMVLNDFFDRAVDARERPERPIPAGEIPAARAAAIGGGLASAGLALAALHGGLPLLVAGLLLGTILAYDALLKDSWAGPWAMGACRGLNVGLGLSVQPALEAWLTPLWLVLALFTLLITQLSRFEVLGTAPERVRTTLKGFMALALAAFAALNALAFQRTSTPLDWLAAALAFSFVVLREQQLLSPIWHEASGPKLGRAIGGGILLMPAIDASFVAAAGAPLAAAATLAFMLPAWLLKRWYYLT
jgi:4-hydroxybenzoate polyprenyltransferase